MTYRSEMTTAIRSSAKRMLKENPELTFDKFLEQLIAEDTFPIHWLPEDCGEVAYEALSGTKYSTLIDCR